MTAATIKPEALHPQLTDGGEIAVLDVRDNEAYVQGHLLLAVNTPLASLEAKARTYVPRPSARVVLCDGNDGLAETAAQRLRAAGYGDLRILEGGVGAWAAAGRELFETNYALANCFGLHVQARYGTPRIDGAELARRRESGEPLVIVDSRPFGEYHDATVPGAFNLPAAELIRRIHPLLTETDTTVVVHCGGKTRGILGCQSLINAGLRNPVFSLDEGTMDWVLAGGALERGADRVAGPAPESGKAEGQKMAARIAERFGVGRLTSGELDAWRSEADRRTLYLIDVRSREEFEAGHLPDARWVPGGQLAGCIEDYIATRNARLCLVDDDEARAVLTASWMLQAGWPEVAVLMGGLAGHALATGPDAFMAAETADEEPETAGQSEGEEDPAAVAASYRRTIAWREGLLEQFGRDGTVRFGVETKEPKEEEGGGQ